MKHTFSVFIVFFLFPSFLFGAADWAFYRGDSGASGVSGDDAAILPGTLEVLWEFQLEKGWFEATPIVADGTVFIGGTEDRFLAVDLETGKEIWSFRRPYGFTAPALYLANRSGEGDAKNERAGGKIFVADSDRNMCALESRTGTLLWEFQAEATIDNSANRWNGYVVFGSQDANLYCLDADTGALHWKYSIEDQIRCFPSRVDDTAFVAGCDGKLHVVDLKRGTRRTLVDIASPSGSTPAVSGDRVFFGTEGNEFLAVDWRTGGIAWHYENLKQAVRGPAAVCESRVVFGGLDRTIYALDPKTGGEIWTYRAKGRIDGGPVIVGDRVYVAATDANMYVLGLEKGNLIQKIELSDQVIGSPAVAEGKLLIATGDGKLVCFGAKSNPKKVVRNF